MRQHKIHYSWIILITGCIVVAGALGLGRFSYGMMLPSLQDGLNLSHNETGFIASANMLGYTMAALAVGGIALRFGSRTVISLSLLGVGLTMFAVGFAREFVVVLLLRFLTGVSSAGANITIMGLSSTWFSENRRGIANGFLVGGSGLALLLTGWLVPNIIEMYPGEGWQYNWMILGGVVLVCGLISAIFIRNHPQEKGISPLADKSNNCYDKKISTRIYTSKEILNFKGVRFIAFSYFCFGMSYIIYMTFFANYLIGEKGVAAVVAGDIWSLVGILSIGSAILWGILSDKIGRPCALAIVFFLQAISYLMLAGTTEILFIWLSAIIFGLTAWSVPGIMASYCGDLLGPKNATGTLGLITLFFSIGSVLGPSTAGYIKELSSSFAAAFYLAAGLALMGSIFSFSQYKNSAKKI